MKIANPRDLLLQLLGELLYVERRLAGGVLQELADAAHDTELRALLELHLEQTRIHVERCETAFRRLDASPSAHRSAAFEAALAEHAELSANIGPAALADAFHAQAALRTEHLELALYTIVLALGGDPIADLRASLADEDEARKLLERKLDAR